MNHRILAAGGLVWRDRSRREILLVHRHRHDDWTLPKGKLDPGETFVAGALREAREETGQRVELDSWAGETFYEVDGRPKSVLWWNMLAVPGQVGAVDADEVRAAVWLGVDDALARMTWADERDLVTQNRVVGDAAPRHDG